MDFFLSWNTWLLAVGDSKVGYLSIFLAFPKLIWDLQKSQTPIIIWIAEWIQIVSQLKVTFSSQRQNGQ